MSRTDYATLTIVVLCIIALIALTYRVVNLGKGRTSPPDTLINQPPYTDPYAVDTLSQLDTLPTANPLPIAPIAGNDSIRESVKKAPQDPVPTQQPATTPATDVAVTPPTPTPKPRKRPAATTTGPYLVVAGTFRSEANAQERVKILKKMGYPQARVGFFNQHTFASAIAGNYPSAQAAQSVANAIQQQGIEAIVKKKQ